MIETFSLAFVAFLVTIDPLGIVPVFLGVTGGVASAGRRRIAAQGVLVGGLILLVFAVLGEAVLDALGITLPAFRIAGGLMLLAIAFEMVFERRNPRRGGTAEHIRDEQKGRDEQQGHDAQKGFDLAVFPLGIPLIAGPGAITAAILQMTRAEGDLAAQGVVLAALLLNLLLLFLTLWLAAALGRHLTPTLIQVFSRLLGLVLGALAVQFVIDGIRQAFLAA
ncbi:MAG: MarC family protein [Geminicoccaceae bacterium]|nr:MarC family protein [Geminicoccaceae bacterium]